MEPRVTYNNPRKNLPHHTGQTFRPIRLFIKEKSSKKNNNENS